jgi:hypothetical protein
VTCLRGNCPKEPRHKGFCEKHYREDLKERRVTPLPTCSVVERGEKCNGVHVAQGFCDLHYRRFQRHGDPLFVTERKDWNHHGYFVEVPTYASMHQRIYRKRGKASTYTCINCGTTAAEWACIRNKTVEGTHCGIKVRWSINVDDYDPMCSRCHARLDAQAIAGEAHYAAKLNEEMVRELRARAAAGEVIVHLAREFGMNDGTVRDAIAGRTWTHLGGDPDK